MGENVLLSLSLIKPQKKQLTPIPYWISVDYETKVISFIPVSKESLENLRYIFYTFSTKVNTYELNNTSPDKTSDMVVSELVKNGYLDTNLYLTKSFNIDKDFINNYKVTNGVVAWVKKNKDVFVLKFMDLILLLIKMSMSI